MAQVNGRTTTLKDKASKNSILSVPYVIKFICSLSPSMIQYVNINSLFDRLFII